MQRSSSIVKIQRALVKLVPSSIRIRLPRDIYAVLLTSKESQFFNRRHRNKDKPANVLSLRYNADYGEILVCTEVIRREAKKQGNSFKYQMTWMILHGMLHLAGIHHESSRIMAERVEKLEHSILAKVIGKKAQSTRSKA